MTNSSRLLLALFVLAAPFAAQAERINIAAIVNDEVITTTDVNERAELLMAVNGLPPTAEVQQKLRPRVVESLVNEALQMQEAKRLSIAVKKAELDAAVNQLEQSRGQASGTMDTFLNDRGLSRRSLDAQLSAQLAWNKVVQRKLRREVSISADEIARAQTAQAAAPGVAEVKMAAITVMAAKPEEETAAATQANEIAQVMRQGVPFNLVAVEQANKKNVRISAPTWVEEDALQPGLQQAVRSLRPGEVTPPIKSQNTYQLIQVLERRVAKKLPDTTEVAVKEMSLPAPTQATAQSIMKLEEQIAALRKNPGSCMDMTTGVPEAQVRYQRAQLKEVSPDARRAVSQIGVTEVSEPVLSPQAVRLFLLCERIEPGMGNLPPADEVRQKLFADKIELEAQKLLRNLKRDAFIEIKQGA